MAAVLYVATLNTVNTLMGITFPRPYAPGPSQPGWVMYFWVAVLGFPVAIAAGTVLGVWLGRTQKLMRDDDGELDPRTRKRQN
jgi:hypothetical protein